MSVDAILDDLSATLKKKSREELKLILIVYSNYLSIAKYCNFNM